MKFPKNYYTFTQNHAVALQKLIYKFDAKLLRMKMRKPDSKGNIIMGTTGILILMLLLMCIFVLSSINYIQNQNIESQANDNFKYIIDDYSTNLEVLGRESIAEATEKVYNGLPIRDSE